MLRFASYDVVFQEVPNEVTLAINITGCPNGCKGCHSPHLQEDRGEILDQEAIASLLIRYQRAITCVCFMGGDSNPLAVEELATLVRTLSDNRLKTAWYSGKSQFPMSVSLAHFDYLKLGPYVERLGGLDSPTTNQRFFKIEQGRPIDCTHLFAIRTPASLGA